MTNKLFSSLKDHLFVMSQLESLFPKVDEVTQRIALSLRKGGKIFWMGNGGSAADAQHLAAELVGRFTKERRALPAISLSTDTSILTCLSNDYDYSIIFSRQLEALCKSEDVVIGLSTSGNSKNILKGMQAAKKIGAYTVGLCGAGGQLSQQVDLCINVPSTNTARIQEAHIFIGHAICEMVEDDVFASEAELEAAL